MNNWFFICVNDVDKKNHYINLHEIKYFTAIEDSHEMLLTFYGVNGEYFQIKTTIDVYIDLSLFFKRHMETSGAV